MRSGTILLAMAAIAAAAGPASAQTQKVSWGAAAIEAPVGINVTDDVPMHLLLSQNSVTFVNGMGSGSGALGMAGFVVAGEGQLRIQPVDDYSATGTTIGRDVLSVSVASGRAAAGQGEEAEAGDRLLRVVLAQYN